MAKRSQEEFNPWPPFVDLFSSVILVLLLIILILIVEVAYFSQFKYKITYEGQIIEVEPTKNAVIKVDHIIDKHTIAKKTTTAVEQKLIIEKNATLNPKFTFEKTTNITIRDAVLDSGGYKLKDARDLNKTTNQIVKVKKDLFAVKYKDSKEIF